MNYTNVSEITHLSLLFKKQVNQLRMVESTHGILTFKVHKSFDINVMRFLKTTYKHWQFQVWSWSSYF
jgi:hypothetical protein